MQIGSQECEGHQGQSYLYFWRRGSHGYDYQIATNEATGQMRIESWGNTVDYPDYIGDELFCRVDYTRTLTEDVKISETFSDDFAITPAYDQEHVSP